MIHQPFFVPAALIALAVVPLILGLVPRNRFYGIRTKQTLAEDSIWYLSNRWVGIALLVASVIYLAFSGILPMSGPKDPRFDLWLMHLAFFAVPTAGLPLLTLRYLR